jgi:hypothetical protein
LLVIKKTEIGRIEVERGKRHNAPNVFLAVLPPCHVIYNQELEHLPRMTQSNRIGSLRSVIIVNTLFEIDESTNSLRLKLPTSLASGIRGSLMSRAAWFIRRKARD